MNKITCIKRVLSGVRGVFTVCEYPATEGNPTGSFSTLSFVNTDEVQGVSCVDTNILLTPGLDDAVHFSYGEHGARLLVNNQGEILVVEDEVLRGGMVSHNDTVQKMEFWIADGTHGECYPERGGDWVIIVHHPNGEVTIER